MGRKARSLRVVHETLHANKEFCPDHFSAAAPPDGTTSPWPVPRMISAEQFLVILQEKDLLPADLIQRVRGQLKQAESPPTAEVLAEQLIAEGFLTPVLVKRLLEQPSAAATSPAAGTVPISASTKGDSPIFGPTPGVAARKSGQSPAQAEPDELGLAPLDNEPGAGWAPSRLPNRPPRHPWWRHPRGPCRRPLRRPPRFPRCWKRNSSRWAARPAARPAGPWTG